MSALTRKSVLLIIILLPLIGWSQTKGSGGKFVLNVKNPPKITWNDPVKDTVQSKNSVMPIDAVVRSKMPYKSVDLFLNELPKDKYTIAEKVQGEVREEYEIKVNQMIDLRPGINVLKIVAINQAKDTVISQKYIMASMGNLSTLEDGGDENPPQIYVGNPPNMRNDYVRYSKDMIKISGSIMDESGVKSLKINGINTPIRSNGNYVINLPLVMGENPVTMEAADINGNIALKKFTVLRRDLSGGEYVAAKAKNYLIVIGINDYQQWPKLNNAVNDAEDVARVLQEKYQFDSEYVTVLKDQEATRENIYQTLRDHISKVGPQDNLMIYYSGHGYFDELLNEGYWVPVDAGKKSVSDFLQNAVLLNILKNIDSQHTFLVADACFSGSLFAASTRGFIDNVEKYKSRWGLASGRLEVVSDGDVGSNSPFAETFIQYLNENEKERVSVSQLIQHMKIEVSEKSDQTPIGNPLKGAGDEGGEFIFYKRN